MLHISIEIILHYFFLEQNIMIYIHAGIRDSSGIRLYYTGTLRKYDAGIIQLGYFVHSSMIVPPNAKNFTINSICIEDCTSEVYSVDIMYSAIH